MKDYLIVGCLQRPEKRDALNVVPMKVGQKDPGVKALAGVFLHEQVAETPDAGSSIKNKISPLGRRTSTQRVFPP